jgi:hypothetical protein
VIGSALGRLRRLIAPTGRDPGDPPANGARGTFDDGGASFTVPMDRSLGEAMRTAFAAFVHWEWRAAGRGFVCPVPAPDLFQLEPWTSWRPDRSSEARHRFRGDEAEHRGPAGGHQR